MDKISFSGSSTLTGRIGSIIKPTKINLKDMGSKVKLREESLMKYSDKCNFLEDVRKEEPGEIEVKRATRSYRDFFVANCAVKMLDPR